MAFGIRALSRSKLHRLITSAENKVDNTHEEDAFLSRPARGGSMTVLPTQLECGEILSQDMVSFVL